MKFRRLLLLVQGSYTFLTAIWPIVHIESFMLVTGYKTDIWLVKTVGVLLACIGLCMLVSIYDKEDNFPVALLALTTAIGMAYVDFFYALNDTIPDIYMADGATEILFALAWLYVLVRGSKTKSRQ